MNELLFFTSKGMEFLLYQLQMSEILKKLNIVKRPL
jgi:hypothetical protein